MKQGPHPFTAERSRTAHAHVVHCHCAQHEYPVSRVQSTMLSRCGIGVYNIIMVNVSCKCVIIIDYILTTGILNNRKCKYGCGHNEFSVNGMG